MTLKDELEVLRGEPIRVFDGEPMDIPCIETSDSVKLCNDPVVSVQMITYNHEPYIRKAIEGVMMQETDFEFELVIGEDCSQDRTREICFEYQKKFPDKIRVLWWHENVSKLGGNNRRTRARCRGEYIAFCEGDDWWLDPLKLQKQVDVMRKHPSVGFCFCNGRMIIKDKEYLWGEDCAYRPGLVPSREFMLKHLLGVRYKQSPFANATSLLTASILLRRETYLSVMQQYEIFKWNLVLSDSTLWLGLASKTDCYYMPDVVCVYNQISSGICQTKALQLSIDSLIVRIYYFISYFKRRLSDMPIWMIVKGYRTIMLRTNPNWLGGNFAEHTTRCLELPHIGDMLRSTHVWYVLLTQRIFRRPFTSFFNDLFDHCLNINFDPSWVIDEYARLGLVYRYGKNTLSISEVCKGLFRRLYKRVCHNRES